MKEKFEKALETLETELKCVKSTQCERAECAECDLVMEEKDIVQSLLLAQKCVKFMKDLSDTYVLDDELKFSLIDLYNVEKKLRSSYRELKETFSNWTTENFKKLPEDVSRVFKHDKETWDNYEVKQDLINRTTLKGKLRNDERTGLMDERWMNAVMKIIDEM